MLNHYRRNFLFGQAIQNDCAASFVKLRHRRADMFSYLKSNSAAFIMLQKFHKAVANFFIADKQRDTIEKIFV